MVESKLVLPGEYLLSCEEAEAGENTYIKDDDIYSAAFGYVDSKEGVISVKRKGSKLVEPYIGMEVYGIVVKTTSNKAILSCIPVSETEGGARSKEIKAVLPVTAIRKGYVEDIRREVKIGDIVKGKIEKIMKSGIDIGIFKKEYGLVAVFCPRCRIRMDLKDNIFICKECEWKEKRKIALG